MSGREIFIAGILLIFCSLAGAGVGLFLLGRSRRKLKEYLDQIYGEE